MILSVSSDIAIEKLYYESPKYKNLRKKELNKINKIVVKIKGYSSKTFKKPVKVSKCLSCLF
jgi:hypothetical protein